VLRRLNAHALVCAPLIAACLLTAASGRGDVARAAAVAQVGGCAIAGQLRLGGREAHGGAAVQADDGPVVATEADGRFQLHGLVPGTFRLRATRSRYLSAVAEEVPCVAGALTTMGSLDLAGGDADSNERVNLFDLVRISAHYRQCGTEAGFDPLADLNDSGCVDLFDLVMVMGNYDRVGPVGWTVDDVAQPDLDDASFQADVLPVFQRYCRGCHGFAAGLTLDSYASLMAGGTNGPMIVPGDPQASRLFLRVSRQLEPWMPPGTMRLTDAEIDALRRWIQNGAPDN